MAHVKRSKVEAGADPGFFARGFKFTKGGFDLKIIPDNLLANAVFVGNSS